MVIAVQLHFFLGYNNIPEALYACTRGTHVDAGVKIYMRCCHTELPHGSNNLKGVPGPGKCLITTCLYHMKVLNVLLQLLAMSWNVSFVFQFYGILFILVVFKS